MKSKQKALALYQGGRQPHNVWWLGLLVQRRQENATFALFRRGDFDLGIGGQTAVEGGERRLYFAAQVLHKHLRLTRLLESCVIFVAPEVKVFRQVLVGIAEAVRAFNPYLFAAYLFAQGRQYAPFIGDTIDRPAAFVVPN